MLDGIALRLRKQPSDGASDHLALIVQCLSVIPGVPGIVCPAVTMPAEVVSIVPLIANCALRASFWMTLTGLLWHAGDFRQQSRPVVLH